MYQRKIIYHQQRNEKLTVRKLLQKWLIPKKWQHFLRIEKSVTVNGKYRSFNELVHDKDLITLKFSFPPRSDDQTYLPGQGILNVVFENEDVLVVNKKSGQKTHPNLKTESDTLFNDAETYLAKKNQHPFMVHRIDMETSGLVLISKSPYLVPIFNRQLSSKDLKREYLAIVDLNKPIDKSGTIDLPIGLDPNDKRKRMVRKDGQNAITEYSVIQKSSDYALLKLNLLTGRTHQLRVHLSHLGWPIVNDPLYNLKKSDGKLMLFAHQLSYIEPFGNNLKTITTPMDSDMHKFVQNNL